MQSSQAYCVGIAHDDFDEKHTMLQVMSRLQSLTSMMDQVFDRILVRVNEEADRIGEIDGRIADAKAKVDAVTGSKTATTVHCAAKFPVSEKLVGFKTFNHDMPFKRAPDINPEEEGDSAPYIPSESKTSLKKEREMIRLFETINPDLSSFETGLKMGLGQLPSYMPSVSSMLLFDTKETPYKDYNILPSLMGRSGKKRDDGPDERKIDEAPDTFMNPDAALRAQQLDFLHRPAAPDLAPMEFIDLKDFDPAFSNIASNINFASLDGALPSIAPTAHQKSGFDLPAIMDAPGSKPGKPPPPLTTTTSTSTAPPPPPPVVSKPPPPPPPPSTSANVRPSPATTAASSNAPAVAAKPPPSTAPKRNVADTRPKAKRPPSLAGGLLGDIAKGVTLKSAKKRKLKKKKKKEKPSLADELRKRLGRRADFMSGKHRSKKKKKSKKKSRRPALQTKKKEKSNMNFTAIPKQRKRTSTFDDDDDWDD